MKKVLSILIIIALLPLSAVTANGTDGDLIAQGHTGEAVVRIQKRLADLGYYNYKPTGSFQAVTRTAVVNFQVQSGIMSDGTVGYESQAQLFSRSAARNIFTPTVPISFSSPSGLPQHKGRATDWYDVESKLVRGSTYQVTNCYTGATANLIFNGGANHAEMVPATSADTNIINGWIGNTNSYYKCAVTVNVEQHEIAASIQWGNGYVCVYFTNSKSHVNGMADIEHEMLIQSTTDNSL